MTPDQLTHASQAEKVTGPRGEIVTLLAFGSRIVHVESGQVMRGREAVRRTRCTGHDTYTFGG